MNQTILSPVPSVMKMQKLKKIICCKKDSGVSNEFHCLYILFLLSIVMMKESVICFICVILPWQDYIVRISNLSSAIFLSTV